MRRLNSRKHQHRSSPLRISFAKHVGALQKPCAKQGPVRNQHWGISEACHFLTRFSGWRIYSFIWPTFSEVFGVSISESWGPLSLRTLWLCSNFSHWELHWEAPLAIMIFETRLKQNLCFLDRGTPKGPGLRSVSPHPLSLPEMSQLLGLQLCLSTEK